MEKNLTAIAVIAAIVLVGFGAWYFTSSLATYSGTSESITIGGFPYDASALIYIAQDQGLFAGNGLNVTLRNYNSSLSAINGLLKNEVDFSVSSEYNIVGATYKRANISVIGSIDKFETVYLVGRKDKGIVNVSDLKGKKIGVDRCGIGGFYLGRFLDLHGMSIREVTLVDMPPSQFVESLTNGSIDALISGAYIDQIQERLSSNVVLWPAQSSQSGYWVMSCRGDWASSHLEQIKRILKSLDQAEGYAIKHPAQAKAIVQKRLNFSDAYMAAVWPEHQFSLSLDLSLLIAMNDEGRWMINNNLTTEKTLPYFRDYIYTKGLEEVSLEAVNIK